MVDTFRLENYGNSTLDLHIFFPCLTESVSWTKQFLCKLNIDMKFGTIDLRNNNKLKYLGSYPPSAGNLIRKINVQSFLVANCSLSVNLSDPFRSRYYGLDMIGSQLEHVDLSHNHITYIKDDGFNWPSLKTFNLSLNRIPDLGSRWFKNNPNVDVIDLSHNHIENIWKEAFAMNYPDPNKMEKEILIDLSHNWLSEFSKFHNTAFRDLKRPSKFNLKDNEFHFLPETSVEVLTMHGNSIDMGNNMLICDCKSRWIQEMAIVYKPRLNNYSCLNFNNESIFNVTKNVCTVFD